MSDSLSPISNEPESDIGNRCDHIDSASINEEPMPKVGIYLRVSTKQQTIEQQEEELDLLARIYRLDLSKAKRYREHGASANKEKYWRIQDRPRGRELWLDLEEGRLDQLIVLDLDRCWRNGVTGVTEATTITQEFGVQLMAVMGGAIPIDLTTSAGFSAFWNEMGKAQAECMKTRERVMRKQKFNQSVGKAVTGTCYGWKKDADGFIEPDLEQLAVLAWFKSKTEGRWGQSPNVIAGKLNDMGVPTALAHKNPESKWKGQTLERQLKSDTHLNHVRNLATREVNHPILGTVRIGIKELVRADRLKTMQQSSKSLNSHEFRNSWA